MAAVRQLATSAFLALPKGQNGVLEVQKIRSELLALIQNAKSTQESLLKGIDTRISEIHRDLEPRFQDLEERHSASLEQLGQTQKKVNDMIATDVSALRRQFDDLLMKFDRFAKVEVQSKLKPMTEELKQSRSKLDELSSTTNTSFKRLTDQVKALNDSATGTTTRLQSEQARFAARLDELEPKLVQLEQQCLQLRAKMHDPGASVSASYVAKQIEEIVAQAARLEQEVVPTEIAKSRRDFDETIVAVREDCLLHLKHLERGLDDLAANSGEIEGRRGRVDDSLSTATSQSYDVERNFSKLNDGTKMRMKVIEQNITSKLAIMKSKLADFQAEQESQTQEFNDQVTNDVAALGQQIQRSAQGLKGEVKSKNRENQQAQEETLQAIAAMKDLFDGAGNISGKIATIEEQLTGLCDEMIKRITAREEAPDACPQNTVNRLKALEDRLLEAEKRIDALDSQGCGEAAKYTPEPENIPPEPPLAAPAEADADGAADGETEGDAARGGTGGDAKPKQPK